MIMSDELVQLIAELQRDASDAGGRRRLLDYIRAQSGARLALLFVWNESGDALLLLECSGQRVRSQKTSRFADRVPPDGLFGEALHTGEALRVTHAAADARALDSERSWLAAGDDAVLIRVVRHNEAKGVLVLCLDASSSQLSGSDEDGLLFCAALLSAYLSPEERRPKARRKVAAASAQTDAPAGASAAAVERERARIARDMHDGVVQQLAAVLQRLELARRILETRPDAARRQLDEAALLINESLIELRHVIVSPVPLQLEEQGLTAALRKLAQETTRAEPSLRVEVESTELGLLPVTLEAVIYRLAQESLANARKHAQATRAVIRLRLV